MPAPFDLLAGSYDTDFTDTPIGRIQRNQVWKYIDSLVFTHPAPALLELNCGTGADALYFSKKGYKVTATDVSGKMVEITEKKAINEQRELCTIQCDMLDIGNIFPQCEFDLVFSNFGGLNCIASVNLIPFANEVSKVLKPGGRFIGVIMPRFCLWDSLYFFSKFKLKKSIRRWSKKSTLITFKEVSFPIWYYNPNQFARFFEPRFKIVSVKPVGLFIPPSYLNGFFTGHPRLLSFLEKMENKTENLSCTASFADHFMIDLIKVE